LVVTSGITGSALDAARTTNAAAGAAVGSVSYLIWFIGLIVSAIGAGSTAIIARAFGANHRRLANKVCGQSVLAAAALGTATAIVLYLAAGPITVLIGLHGHSAELFAQYLRILVIGVPFAVVMFTANACLRGSGDTLAPAAAMIVVDVVNVIFSVGLTYGAFGLPAMGFVGIAYGTTLAYLAGGSLQIIVLLSGRRRLRLFLHRLRPDWLTMKRVFRIGLPSGAEGLMWWVANFAVIATVNRLGDNAAAAHSLAVRVESFSYMSGMAVGTAVATLVGHSLGAGHPRRAKRVALVGYAAGGGIMAFAGLLFVVFSHWWAGLFTADPAVQALTAQCLFLTGFIQCGMAASIIFGSALRGAGDTVAAMLGSLGSVVIIRCIGVTIAGRMGASLRQIWMLLCLELMCRGLLLFGRFATGRWTTARV
ncbi:MAG: putative MatE family transporter, partial [Phycisphaerales bacterium]|nr:putative MatE family transporter [Phycisphaerales bacterium]